ncbi:4-oxalocrotonate tautomerase [Malonomonas rubra DSM 5091]|uniref:Tautomerase n=1 Tax=Malonomonas rubra DSM 5091 TaxID=1122189 RepID=A0A1M6BT31_MALRU|nr:4-oxalocrotonate tautomerase family protein [Malonomonas rubra]SHI51841.1 4-oxalocrotonate tautomerase [Malonomonas rubra DSM 5091]
MPFINVNITKGATNEQKAELIEGITDLMVKILDKNPFSTHVIINEVETENWGIAGRSVKKLREEGKTANISKK